MPESLLQAKACNFIKKETLAQVFSCKFCEIFKNTFFTEHFHWLLLQVVCYTKECKSFASTLIRLGFLRVVFLGGGGSI